MDRLAALLALNGVFFILFSSLVGLLLARTLHLGKPSENWHLLHASGTSRGIMLLALAAIVPLADLPFAHVCWASGLVAVFVWTSVAAMFLRALTGAKGFHPSGSVANRFVFVLYAIGTITLPIGLVWLMVGFLQAAI